MATIVDKKIKFSAQLEMTLGEQKIDIVVKKLDSTFHLPIYDIARTEGIRLV